MYLTGSHWKRFLSITKGNRSDSSTLTDASLYLLDTCPSAWSAILSVQQSLIDEILFYIASPDNRSQRGRLVGPGISAQETCVLTVLDKVMSLHSANLPSSTSSTSSECNYFLCSLTMMSSNSCSNSLIPNEVLWEDPCQALGTFIWCVDVLQTIVEKYSQPLNLIHSQPRVQGTSSNTPELLIEHQRILQGWKKYPVIEKLLTLTEKTFQSACLLVDAVGGASRLLSALRPKKSTTPEEEESNLMGAVGPRGKRVGGSLGGEKEDRIHWLLYHLCRSLPKETLPRLIPLCMLSVLQDITQRSLSNTPSTLTKQHFQQSYSLLFQILSNFGHEGLLEWKTFLIQLTAFTIREILRLSPNATSLEIGLNSGDSLSWSRGAFSDRSQDDIQKYQWIWTHLRETNTLSPAWAKSLLWLVIHASSHSFTIPINVSSNGFPFHGSPIQDTAFTCLCHCLGGHSMKSLSEYVTYCAISNEETVLLRQTMLHLLLYTSNVHAGVIVEWAIQHCDVSINAINAWLQQFLLNLSTHLLRTLHRYGGYGNGSGFFLLEKGGHGVLFYLSSSGAHQNMLMQRLLKQGCPFSAKLLLALALCNKPTFGFVLLRKLLLFNETSKNFLSAGHSSQRQSTATALTRIFFHLLDELETSLGANVSHTHTLTVSHLASYVFGGGCDSGNLLLSQVLHPVLQHVKHNSTEDQQLATLNTLLAFLCFERSYYPTRRRLASALSAHADELIILLRHASNLKVISYVFMILRIGVAWSYFRPISSRLLLSCHALIDCFLQIVQELVRTTSSVSSSTSSSETQHPSSTAKSFPKKARLSNGGQEDSSREYLHIERRKRILSLLSFCKQVICELCARSRDGRLLCARLLVKRLLFQSNTSYLLGSKEMPHTLASDKENSLLQAPPPTNPMETADRLLGSVETGQLKRGFAKGEGQTKNVHSLDPVCHSDLENHAWEQHLLELLFDVSVGRVHKWTERYVPLPHQQSPLLTQTTLLSIADEIQESLLPLGSNMLVQRESCSKEVALRVYGEFKKRPILWSLLELVSYIPSPLHKRRHNFQIIIKESGGKTANISYEEPFPASAVFHALLISIAHTCFSVLDPGKSSHPPSLVYLLMHHLDKLQIVQPLNMEKPLSSRHYVLQSVYQLLYRLWRFQGLGSIPQSIRRLNLPAIIHCLSSCELQWLLEQLRTRMLADFNTVNQKPLADIGHGCLGETDPLLPFDTLNFILVNHALDDSVAEIYPECFAT